MRWKLARISSGNSSSNSFTFSFRNSTTQVIFHYTFFAMLRTHASILTYPEQSVPSRSHGSNRMSLSRECNRYSLGWLPGIDRLNPPLIRGRLLDVADGSPLIRRRSFNMVNHDDFDGPLAGFQFQAKLLLKGVEQRGGIGIGWGGGSLSFGARPLGGWSRSSGVNWSLKS
jgi:hypothetical protein